MERAARLAGEGDHLLVRLERARAVRAVVRAVVAAVRAPPPGTARSVRRRWRTCRACRSARRTCRPRPAPGPRRPAAASGPARRRSPARSSQPTASIRTVPCGTRYAALTAMPCRTVEPVQVLADRAPVEVDVVAGVRRSSRRSRVRTSARVRSSTGAYDRPSWPRTSRVTPWAAFALWSGSRSSARSLWACMSMKPGARTRPSASSVRRAAGAGGPPPLPPDDRGDPAAVDADIGAVRGRRRCRRRRGVPDDEVHGAPPTSVPSAQKKVRM